MYVNINIEGKTGGNFILLTAISPYGYKPQKRMFGGYDIPFKRKSDARNALKKAYKKLIEKEPDMKDVTGGGITLNKQCTVLEYDASIAKIEKWERDK